jgi:excisionase family DNA binding protein
MKKQKTLNISEVAEYIGVSRRTFYNMIEDGRFPVKPIKGTDPRRWNVDSIDSWCKKK